ncbi:hypothetical protein [Thermoactinomyces daqus]|uniref:hypothetical protein n=1 Tax=Thermoactinomyces daqus TaxID=1329516 RepID=UPI00051A4315|nr:hypothetical protein [Thermoactinomyces daqus]
MVLDFFRRSQPSQLRKNQFATLLLEFKEIQHWVNWEGRYMSSRELKKEYGIKRPLFLLISQWENENPLSGLCCGGAAAPPPGPPPVARPLPPLRRPPPRGRQSAAGERLMTGAKSAKNAISKKRLKFALRADFLGVLLPFGNKKSRSQRR